MTKTTKKLLAIVLSSLLIFSCGISALAAYEPATKTLRFNEDGKFTIMQFADCQDDDEVAPAMIAFMNEALDEVKPDLVVFTGDNVVTENFTVGANAIIEPVASRGIPYAITFGNHDYECCKISREEMLDYFCEIGECITTDAVPEIYGCGNCNNLIYASDGSMNPVFNLWFIDSNDYDSTGAGKYDCVHADQIEWYKSTSEAIEANYGRKIPSLLFQHIIVPEIYDVFNTVGINKVDVALGAVSSFVKGNTKFSGYLLEFPCSPVTNEGQFDAAVERGDILGMAFGHDHTNSFVATYKGIDIIQSPSCTYESYGNDLTRGARVFTLDENDPWSYESYVLTVKELALRDGSTIPQDKDNVKVFSLMFYQFIERILNTLKRILAMFIK